MEKLFTIAILLGNYLLTFLPKETIITFNMVENISNPQQVIWRSMNEVVFVKDENIFLYIVPTKKISIIGNRENNEFVGLDSKGDILLCSIEHYIITSPSEFSTKFSVLGKELYFFETIRPIFLTEEKIVAVTALDFLEQHYYEIEIQSGEKKEIGEPKVKKYVWDRDRYIVKDIFGNLYVYSKRDITYIRYLIFKYLQF